MRFGTDGVRGRAPEQLSPEFIRRLAFVAASELSGDTMLVGRDPRASGELLRDAVVEGCHAAGVEVRDLGVVPTPAVAWMGKHLGLPGAMLSASHNPWFDNGLKLFSPGGLKLTDAEQDRIQRRLDDGDTPGAGETGSTDVGHLGIDAYVDTVVDSVAGTPFDGIHVALDCAHGAAVATAVTIFERLGAQVSATGIAPTGQNINDGVGSTHTESIIGLVQSCGADVGFAFDGDADRVVGCGRDGSLIDGDRLIAMTALDRRDRGLLPDDTVVITVMTNLGFRRAMAEAGVTIAETGVGDRHVLEALDANGWVLGGEQSGHIIHRDLATTGDGVLSAVQVLDAAVRRSVDVGRWADDVMTSYPQVLENVRLDDRPAGLIEALADDVAAVEAQLGEEGRVLIRESGTEPLVRVMVEAATPDIARAAADHLAAAVVAQSERLR